MLVEAALLPGTHRMKDAFTRKPDKSLADYYEHIAIEWVSGANS